jgi:hypothetical protein
MFFGFPHVAFGFFRGDPPPIFEDMDGLLRGAISPAVSQLSSSAWIIKADEAGTIGKGKPASLGA